MKKMIVVSLFLVSILLSAFLAGCSANEDASNANYSMNADNSSEEYYEANEVSEAESARTTEDDIDGGLPSNQTIKSEQMVIYNGNITIEVDNYDQANHSIHERVEEMGGYVVESTVHQYGEEELRNGTLVVRIPQEYFQVFLNNVESTSTNVIEKSTQGNDVTEEYTDLESRLRSKKVVEERLLSFMAEADNTESLLQISSDLSDVQQEIETISGRKGYIENRVALSTVTIQIHERSSDVSSIQSRESLNTLQQAQNLFMDTVNFIIVFFSRIFIFVIGFSPVLVPIILISTAVFLFNKKKLTNKTNE